MPKLKYPKKVIKHTSIWRGNLMTFQDYLNTYHYLLSLEERNIDSKQVYKITEWYKQGKLIKILIKRIDLREK